MYRKRSLSNEGLKLFNLNLEPERISYASLICKAFTTKYDKDLIESIEHLRNASYKLYTFYSDDEMDIIPKYINNAIVNIILLILTDGSKILKLKQVKKKFSYYFDIMVNSFNNSDHNTALLIKFALSNTAINRLKIKLSKYQKSIFKKMEDTYGTFINCHCNHIKEVLNLKKYDYYIPSIAILIMHLKKNKEYSKCFQKIGKCPKNIINTHNEIDKIIKIYHNKYKNYDNILINLYTEKPNKLPIIKNINEKQINCKLYELSCKIKS